MIGLLLAMVVAPAAALEGNDALVLELSTAERVSGWHFALQDGVLVLSGENRFTTVPLALVEDLSINGQPVPLADFHADAARLQLELSLQRAHPPPHPGPLAVVGASMLWAGGGHAALGDWRAAAGFMVVDAALLAGAAWSLFGAEQVGPVFPLVGLDLLVRGVSAGEAARRSRARHRRLLVGAPAVPDAS